MEMCLACAQAVSALGFGTLFVARRLRRLRQDGGARRGVLAAIFGALRCRLRAGAAEDGNSLVLKRSRHEISKRHILQTRLLVQALACSFVLFAPALTLHEARGVGECMSLPQHFVYTAYMLATLLACAFPGLIHCGSLSGWYVMLSLGITMNAAFAPPSMYILLCVASYGPRLILTTVPTRVPVVALASGLHAIAVITALPEAPSIGITNNMFVVLEISCSLCSPAVAHAWLSFNFAEVKRDMQANALQKESSATIRLLGLMCDVLLELDEDLRCRVDVPRFSVMFSMGMQQSIKGKRLQEFMPLASDRDRWAKFLSEAPASTDGSATGAMYATMRGSDDGRIGVELFYVKYLDLDESPHYLVGIHEVVDQPLPDLRQFAPPERRRSRGPPSEGTPRAHQALALGDGGDGGRSGAAASHGGGGAALVGGAARLTSPQAQDIGIVAMLLTWNVALPASSCCPYHALVAEAQRSLFRLRSRGCTKHIVLNRRAQCGACGVLRQWSDDVIRQVGGQCDICNSNQVHTLAATESL